MNEWNVFCSETSTYEIQRSDNKPTLCLNGTEAHPSLTVLVKSLGGKISSSSGNVQLSSGTNNSAIILGGTGGIDGDSTGPVSLASSQNAPGSVNITASGESGSITLSAGDGVDMLNATRFRRSSGIYYLEEFFSKRPVLNADLTNAAEATRMPANNHFEILGTNASSDDVTFSSVFAGVQLQTDGADNDQVILLPHLDVNQTAWSGVLWGTENQSEWECAIRTGSAITTVLYWAGLKLSNTPVIATDADQVFFRFSTDDSNTTWNVVNSIGGVDVSTDSGVNVTVDTNYRFRITIDSSRIAKFYINDNLVHTTNSLTNDVDLIPYVGVQALGVATREVHVGYEKMSRLLFE